MERTFYYARVSTKDQNLARQLAKFHEMGADDHDIFMDKASGKDLNREQYQLMQRAIRSGDTLVVASLDRLGRNKTDIQKELRRYQDQRIRVKVLDIPYTMQDAPKGQELYFDMVMNIIIEVVATFAESERQNIRKRQKEGIDAMDRDSNGRHVTKDGRVYGRPEVQAPENWTEVVTEWKTGRITAVQAMEMTGLKKNTFYKLLNKHQIRKEA